MDRWPDREGGTETPDGRGCIRMRDNLSSQIVYVVDTDPDVAKTQVRPIGRLFWYEIPAFSQASCPNL